MLESAFAFQRFIDNLPALLRSQEKKVIIDILILEEMEEEENYPKYV